jgi:predicted Zn-dependent peptidase
MNTPQLVTLPSGMKLVTVDMPGLNSVTVLAMVGVGSRYEDPAKAGISHFLEHLPFKGTENYPTSLALAMAIDGVGGKHNAFTGKEYTGYWVKVGADKFPLALDVVSDLVLTAQLRPEDIDKERGVIIEEINMYEDQPQAKVGDVFEELVYQGSPLERPVIGTKETVSALKRDDFLAHWDRWYDPSHVTLGVVGRVPEGARLEELVTQAFSKGLPRQGGGSHDDQPITQFGHRIKVVHKDTEQAHFHLGFQGISRFDTDRYALNLLSTIVGGNSSSRLFNEIREKRGLAYYAYASADLNRDCGSFYAFEGVALDKAQEAVKVTLAEFEKVLGGDVTQAELDRAKEYVVGKVELDLEDSARMADLVVEKALFEGKVEPIETTLAKYKAVSLDQVHAVAKRVITPEKVNFAIIGPYQPDEFQF